MPRALHLPLRDRLLASFTLVELLAAIFVFAILLLIIGAATQGTALAVHKASGKLSTYAAARSAFDTINAKLAQATLNSYMDYYATNSSGVGYLQTNPATFVPAVYGRVSNLQFLVKQNSNPVAAFNAVGNAGSTGYGQEIYFQSPDAYSTDSAYQSDQGLLNACGYYVQYCSDSNFRPSIISSSRWRYRLMQAIEPTESFQVYADAVSDNTAWTGNIANTGAGAALAADAIPLADNIIAMVVLPRQPSAVDATGSSLAPNYIYDSQLSPAPALTGSVFVQPLTAHQLPPVIQITMLVIDEASAARIDTKTSTPPTVIENALKGKFVSTSNYGSDLASVESSLTSSNIGFEVLTSSVVMRESKWSQ